MTTTIILPTLNEEEAIVQTIRDIKRETDCPILVVDGHSTDRTVLLARLFENVEVIFDDGIGKGAALRQAFEHCALNDVIFVDADGTYQISKIGEFVKSLDDGYDVVIGTKKYEKNSEPHVLGIGLFAIGDRLWYIAFKLLYRKYIDNLSGYRGLSRHAINRMDLQDDGWGIETEISCKTIKGFFTHKEISTRYFKRVGKTKFRSKMFGKDWRDTVLTMFRYRFWRKEQ